MKGAKGTLAGGTGMLWCRKVVQAITGGIFGSHTNFNTEVHPRTRVLPGFSILTDLIIDEECLQLLICPCPLLPAFPPQSLGNVTGTYKETQILVSGFG